MATGSTASSGTDAPEPAEPREPSSGLTPDPAADSPTDAASAPAQPAQESPGAEAASAEAASTDAASADAASADAADDHDPERRAFFFRFGKQAVTAVGQAAGMADIVGRTSSSAAASLLGLDQPTGQAPAPEFTRSGSEPVSAVTTPPADDSFRSPYRLADDELIMLDQRGIPERLDEVVARRGSDVAYYLRIGVSRGGARMAQEAAYGLALTAAERAGHERAAREVELRRTRGALIEARPSSRLIRWAMSRIERAIAALGEDADGVAVAAAVRAEADAIAGTVQAANAAIADALASSLPDPDGRPLGLLIHGDQGALSGGSVGTTTVALRRLRDSGRESRIFVTEGRPFMDGARVASWELRQAGLDHKVLADSAVAWLLAREAIDVVLIGAEWIAANGDVGAVVGSRALAQQAVAARNGGTVPLVLVSGIRATIDPGTPTGADIPAELRPPRDLSAYLADVPVRATDALVPAADVVPAETVDVLVTEAGISTAPDPDAIAALAAGEPA